MKSSLDFLLSSPLFDFHKIIQFRLRLVNRIFFYFFFLRKSQGHRTTSTIRAEGEITSNRRWKIFLLLYFIAHRTRLRRRRIELYNVCLSSEMHMRHQLFTFFCFLKSFPSAEWNGEIVRKMKWAWENFPTKRLKLVHHFRFVIDPKDSNDQQYFHIFFAQLSPLGAPHLSHVL